MGCNTSIDDHCEPDEYPFHEVILSSFWIDKTAVTIGEYKECVAAGACTEPPAAHDKYWGGGFDNYPHVADWRDARDYCEWRGSSLPTEAQWEKAARGTDGRLYPWGNEPPTCELTNWNACDDPSTYSAVGTRPVGQSPYGALDMAGNLNEWCSDRYIPGIYQNQFVNGPVVDPHYPEGSEMVIRGGVFAARLEWMLRVSGRGSGSTNIEGAAFRCAQKE